jgi:two-component system, sporulation sensor kinase E
MKGEKVLIKHSFFDSMMHNTGVCSKEQELAFFQLMIDETFEAIISTNEEFSIQSGNRTFSTLFQLEEANWKGKNFFRLFQFPSIVFKHQFKDSLSLNHKAETEAQYVGPDGTIKYVKIKAVKFNPSIYLFFIRDISFNKQLEEIGLLNRNLFTGMFEQAADAILIFDHHGKIIDANPIFCRIFGVPKEDMIHQKLEKYIPRPFHQRLNKVKLALKKRQKSWGEIPVIHSKGMSIFEYSASPIVDNKFHMAILRDITEKRQIELTLKRSEELFKDLFEEAIDAIVFWDHDGSIIKANESASRIFETPLDELIGKKLWDYVEQKDEQYAAIQKEFYEKGAIRDELLFLMPNGQRKHLEFTSKMHSVDGYNMTIFRNVSERYRMEQELRESEARFRKIFEGSNDGMILWDQQFQIVDVNPEICRIFQKEKEQLIGENLQEWLSKSTKQKKKFEHYQVELEKNGQADMLLSFKLSKNETRHLEISSKKNVMLNLNYTVIRDVTEKLEMQEQLRKSDTLTVVGELAAGIAHEIRNPMTALKGFIQLLQNKMNDDHSMYFDVITSELKRIETIITEFLILAKPQAVQFVHADVTKIMKDTIDLLNAQAMMHNVQFSYSFPKNLPQVYSEPNQLKQVFINIIKNAIEVMPKGGTITITINDDQNGYLIVSIKDEGVGIPEDKIKRLGEPFYTTKDRGTGLGLMVSYKIIKEHNGKVEVESEVGKGTTFHIYLPYSGTM